MVKQALIFVALGILIGFLLTRSCGPEQTKYVKTTDTIPGDSVPYVVYQDKPVPYLVVRWDSVRAKIAHTDTVFIVDTVEALNDYYSAYFYSDTLKDDTSALIVLNEQITQNMIEFRELIFQNRKLTTINHHYPSDKNTIHLGAIGTLTGISGEIGYSYGRNQFGLLYGTQGIGFGYRRTLFEW